MITVITFCLAISPLTTDTEIFPILVPFCVGLPFGRGGAFSERFLKNTIIICTSKKLVNHLFL